MDPTGMISCRMWDDGSGIFSGGGCGGYSPADDVQGHSFTPTRTATVSLSWSEDPNGEIRVDLQSDDPDAQRILAGLLVREDQAEAAR